mgnify:CR=1 FL=1
MKLLRSQKNALFDVITEEGLPPAMFELTEGEETCVRYRPNKEYSLRVQEVTGAKYWIKICPGFETFQKTYVRDKFPGVLDIAHIWVNFLKNEVEVPDKWGQMEKELRKVPALATTGFDLPGLFSVAEYEHLGARMSALKNGLGGIARDEEGRQAVEDKLDRLMQLARSLNKTDWRDLFLGAVMGLILNLTFDKQMVSQVWIAVKEFFSTAILIPQ